MGNCDSANGPKQGAPLEEKKAVIDPNLVLPAPQFKRCGADDLNIHPIALSPEQAPIINTNNLNNNVPNTNNILNNNAVAINNNNINNNGLNNINLNNNPVNNYNSNSNNPNWKNYY